MVEDSELLRTFKVSVEHADLIKLEFLKSVAGDKENTHRARLATNKCYNILRTNPNSKFRMIADLRPMGNESYISADSNKIYRRMAREEQLTNIAVVGNPDSQSKVVSYMLPFAKIFTKVGWFKDMDEAMVWISRKKH